MRPLIALLLGCFALVPPRANAEQSFPYKTYVATEDVYVRSGPGQNYYPTDKLKRGQEIEVWRHDPGGWCAIRPVDGSFTWVSSRFLKPTEGRLAVVTEEGVAARVGSRFSDIREVVQVRLQKGEVVEVLNPSPRGGWGENKWCKISPPSGEFRWVAAKFLNTDYSNDGLRKAPPQAVGKADEGDSPIFAGAKIGTVPAAKIGKVPAAPRIPAAALPGYSAGEIGDPPRAQAPPRPLTPEEFQAELQRIELELSVMVIEEPSVWSFDTLRQRTNYLLDQAQTAVERGRARQLANKIARFDDIRERQNAVLAMRDQTDRNGRLWAGLRAKDGDDKSVAKVELDGRFDGVGQLTQVVSQKVGAPRYALTDESGEVRCYVTPAPGVNLQSLVGRQVGVIGSRSFMLEQHASHIMARRVTPLEGTMLR